MAERPSETAQAHHGHETRDVDIRFIGLFSLGMVVLLAGSLVLMGWLFGVFAGKPLGRGRSAPIVETRPYPPAPRLQASPTRDIQEMRRTENTKLQSYGWIDQTAGIARIPIDQAMELLATRGLPSWNEVSGLPPTEQHSSRPEEHR
jgi:hypothetical protein